MACMHCLAPGVVCLLCGVACRYCLAPGVVCLLCGVACKYCLAPGVVCLLCGVACRYCLAPGVVCLLWCSVSTASHLVLFACSLYVLPSTWCCLFTLWCSL